MHWKGLSLALALSALAATSASARDITPDAPLPRACGYDRAAMLAMPFERFDQDFAEGWRPLADRPGCELAAAEVLAAYRVENSPRLSSGESRLLAWHEGQLRAMVGDIPDAITLITISRAGDADQVNSLYADATLAFLRHDRRALKAARRRLAALPKPDGFDREAAATAKRLGLVVSWPPNLDVVDGLAACFDRPYAEAYGAACRHKAGATRTTRLAHRSWKFL
ncbi:MAG: hypothetical protein JWP35_1539 [Caulobacter sp.]|nr:hypothetical protein [Caulobacter sp.]